MFLSVAKPPKRKKDILMEVTDTAFDLVSRHPFLKVLMMASVIRPSFSWAWTTSGFVYQISTSSAIATYRLSLLEAKFSHITRHMSIVMLMRPVSIKAYLPLFVVTSVGRMS